MNEDFNDKKKELLDELNDEKQQEINEALASGSAADQKAKIKSLEEDAENRKKELLNALEDEKNERLDEEKKKIADKFLQGAENDEELRDQLKQLLGDDQGNMDNYLANADMERQQQEERLR